MKIHSEDVKIYVLELEAEEANVLKSMISKMLTVTAYFEEGYISASVKKGRMPVDLKNLLFAFSKDHRQDLLNLDDELFDFKELPGIKGEHDG